MQDAMASGDRFRIQSLLIAGRKSTTDGDARLNLLLDTCDVVHVQRQKFMLFVELF